MKAVLSVVATPIGNLEDMSLRAIRTLKEADIILCEDTRVTRKLLSHYEVETSTVSFHSHSGPAKTKKIIELLEEGKHVALVSDAGTPGVSDPGPELLSDIREAMGDEVTIEAIPGPSALAAALSIAGLRTSTFTFYGFLPHKKGRETLFKEIAHSDRSSIFYESPHRILKALEVLVKMLPEERRVGIYRELTKMHEQSVVGSAAEVLQYFTDNSDKERGEFVVIVEAL
jgi:16S rRNA (cytidine1402-2'-O)-methyltransferase